MRRYFCSITSLAVLVRAAAPSGPWDDFNYSPASRTVYPTSVHHVEGTVDGAENLIGGQGSVTIQGVNSWLTLDFGKEVRHDALTSSIS